MTWHGAYGPQGDKKREIRTKGPDGTKGIMRQYRAVKREEAETRNAAYRANLLLGKSTPEAKKKRVRKPRTR